MPRSRLAGGRNSDVCVIDSPLLRVEERVESQGELIEQSGAFFRVGELVGADVADPADGRRLDPVHVALAGRDAQQLVVTA
jgi:hypothetical protein